MMYCSESRPTTRLLFFNLLFLHRAFFFFATRCFGPLFIAAFTARLNRSHPSGRSSSSLFGSDFAMAGPSIKIFAEIASDGRIIRVSLVDQSASPSWIEISPEQASAVFEDLEPRYWENN